MLDLIQQHRLLVVTGKGGVGKSTISAALALQSAKAGLRTLVCEINAQERISSLLEHPAVGPNIIQLEDSLWAVNVRPAEAMKEYALMQLKFEFLYNALFENRLAKSFLRFIPSLSELVIMGKILYHVREKQSDGHYRFDRVIIDAPATGHAITLLSVPQVVLNTVPPGPLSNDVRWMRDLLLDSDQTAVVLVAIPEEMPVNETLELAEALKEKVAITAKVAVLNGCISERFHEEEISKIHSERLRQVAQSHRMRAALTTEYRQKLSSGLQLPIVSVPRIYTPNSSRFVIEVLSKHLDFQA